MFPAQILVSGFTSCRFTHTRNVLSLFTAIATATLSLFAHVTRPGSGAIGPFLLCIPRHSFHHTAYVCVGARTYHQCPPFFRPADIRRTH